LQRAAQRMAKTGASPGSPTAAAEAARDLEQQQVSRLIRDSAERLRRAAGLKPESSGRDGNVSQMQMEQQIARALDHVAEKLGAAGSADAKRLADQLAQSQEIRDRLNKIERQVREAEAKERAAAKPGSQGRPSSDGSQGREGREGAAGAGQRGELERLREDYARELERSREALGRLTQAEPRNGLGGSTPEQHEFSRSAPGNEAFKQDRSGWESLRKDLDLALEQYEAGVSARLARRLSEDRLSAGGSDRVPDSYQRLIARYYESLARPKKP
jgi:hypothetical protein